MQKTILSILLFLFAKDFIYAQSSEKFTISGYVREKSSGELLPGVSIYVKGKKIGTQTNNYGFYSMTLTQAEALTFVYSFIGYKAESKSIQLTKNQEVNVILIPEDRILEEVKVVADAPENQRVSEQVQMSQISIPIQQIKEIPALLGEKDVLKVLQLMPGVQKGSEGNSGIYVRGGGPDQNLLILDDAPVYNASHLFGFFSVFNGDALKSVELTKGGFPARFGGRLSSVIEMQMKDGSRDKLHVEGGIGLLASRLVVEGPIDKKHKSSFLISGRRTYIDAIVRPFINKTDGDGGYYFYDLNAKLNYDFGQKDKLYLSGYFGKDVFFGLSKSRDGLENEVGLNWGNKTATLRWNHLFNERLFANTSLILSDYLFKIYATDQSISGGKQLNFELSYSSRIQDIGFKTDFDFLPNPQHAIKAGIALTKHQFSPSAIVVKDDAVSTFRQEVETIDATEGGVYIEDTYRPTDNLKINAGFRLSTFKTNKVSYLNPEPRLAVALSLPNNLALKASYATMNQYIHLLSNSGASLPTDLWVPSTEKVPAQRSKQVAIGIAKDFTEKNLALTVEGFYKEMDNIIALKEGSSFLLLEDGPEAVADEKAKGKTWDDQVTTGKGKSYGAEILLQRKVGKFTGWVGYTLSWIKHQFPELNFGEEFWARYDRRHDVSVVGIYHISPKTTLSGTWVYGTGNAITLNSATYSGGENVLGTTPTGVIYNPDNFTKTPVFGGFFSNTRQVPDYGSRNNFRAEAYHRLDVGIQFHKQMKKGHQRTWEISVYNLYGRRNPFFYNFTSTYNFKTQTTERALTRYSLFGIIPSVSYSFKF